MQIEIDSPGQQLRVGGRISSRELPDLRDTVLSAVHGGFGDLVIDVADVVVTDRGVLGLLLEAHRKAERHDRQLILINVPIELNRLLRRTKLRRVLNCVNPSYANLA